MEIYTDGTSAATRDALKRLGDELSPSAAGQDGADEDQGGEPGAPDREQP